MDPYTPPGAALDPWGETEARFRWTPVLVCSLVIDVLGTLVVITVLAVFFAVSLAAGDVPEAEIQRQLLSDPVYNIVGMVLGLSLTLLSGFAAARWAKNQHTKHGLATGLVSTVFSLPFLFAAPSGEAFFPQWFNWAATAALPLLGWLGGRIAQPASDRSYGVLPR